MNMKPRMLTQFILALGFVVCACSSSNKPSGSADSGAVTEKNFCTLPVSCQQISQACMPKDIGAKGPIHDCHMTGMYYAVKADCDKDLNSCLATCNAAPALSDGAVEDLSATCRDAGAQGTTTTTGTQTGTGTSTGTPTSPGTFPADALSSFMSDGKALNIELRTAPDQPIDVGPGSEGQLKITDAMTGAPVDGLTIAVASWMPVMKHVCSPQQVKVEAEGQGIYHLTQMSASMKGACEYKLTISGTVTDTAVSPTFDITK